MSIYLRAFWGKVPQGFILSTGASELSIFLGAFGSVMFSLYTDICMYDIVDSTGIKNFAPVATRGFFPDIRGAETKMPAFSNGMYVTVLHDDDMYRTKMILSIRIQRGRGK